ncbi:MAG: hypothetical protein COB14_04085 [Alphaproteobacteria bacterium]|nr:MAG: hypothetical protein COB14_04085 [Alphaproteobacteria bacterium]
MTSIQTGIYINSPHVTALDTSKMKAFHVSEAPEELYQSFISAEEKFLKSQYTEHPDTSNHPLYQPYATVQVDGKTVATLYNSGSVSSSNALGAKIQKLFANENTNLSGPAGAQDRAGKIAELLGGTVEKSSTAMTQAQFNATGQPQGTVDYKAMHEDPMYEKLQKTKQARTLFLAQQIAQEGLQDNTPAEKVILDTSNGKEALDIDAYFAPQGKVDLDTALLLTPSANNIDALSKHASTKLQNLLTEYGIPEGPDKITYDTAGNIKFPADYPYADELKQALQENDGLARELSTIAALTSHLAGMQAAAQGTNSHNNYIDITLNFSANGEINVTANGKPYNTSNDNKNNRTNLQTQQTAPSGVEESTESVSNDPDPVKEFLDYMSKTPEERWFDAMLAEKGLTREQYDALPPEEKLALEIEIQEKIKERTAQKAEEGTVITKQDTDTITASSPTEATQSPPADENYPLEYYQLPEWLAQHSNELSSQLGAKPETETGSSSDRAEYAALIQKHYQSILKDAGISSVEDHYKATILDKASSETLHQQMNTRLQEDTRVLELAEKLDRHIS